MASIFVLVTQITSDFETFAADEICKKLNIGGLRLCRILATEYDREDKTVYMVDTGRNKGVRYSLKKPPKPAPILYPQVEALTVTIFEAAEMLGQSIGSVNNLLKQGKIDFAESPDGYRVFKDSIQIYMDDRIDAADREQRVEEEAQETLPERKAG